MSTFTFVQYWYHYLLILFHAACLLDRLRPLYARFTPNCKVIKSNDATNILCRPSGRKTKKYSTYHPQE